MCPTVWLGGQSMWRLFFGPFSPPLGIFVWSPINCDREKEQTNVHVRIHQATYRCAQPFQLRELLASVDARACRMVELASVERMLAMSKHRNLERGPLRCASTLRNVLLNLLQSARLLPVPGGDSLTLDDALGCYSAGIAAGLVPNEEQLVQMHPELLSEIKEFFRSIRLY